MKVSHFTGTIKAIALPEEFIMSKTLELLDRILEGKNVPILFRNIRDYIETGNERDLKLLQVTFGDRLFWEGREKDFTDTIEFSDPPETEQIRALEVLIRCGDWSGFTKKLFESEKDADDFFSLLRGPLLHCELSEAEIFRTLLEKSVHLNSEGNLNSWARFHLDLSDEEFERCLKFKNFPARGKITEILLEHSSERLERFLDRLLLEPQDPNADPLKLLHLWNDVKDEPEKDEIKLPKVFFVTESAYAILSREKGKKHSDRIFELWSLQADGFEQFYSGLELLDTDPELFYGPLKSLTFELLEQGPETFTHNDFWLFIAKRFAREQEGRLCEMLRTYDLRFSYWTPIPDMLSHIWDELGIGSSVFFEAAFENPQAHIVHSALETLIAKAPIEAEKLIEAELRRNFARKKDPWETADYVSCASSWRAGLFEEEFWKLLNDKSVTVSREAISAICKIGTPDKKRLEKLLSGKKAEGRESAILILNRIGDEDSIARIEKHFEIEQSEKVRETVLQILDSKSGPGGYEISPEKIRKRIELLGNKITGVSVPWLDIDSLPPFSVGSKKIDPVVLRYIIYRQSHCKEIRADIEIRSLFKMIDRKTSGDFAFEVLDRFLKSEAKPDDRWALVLAGMLGDDRIVPVLSRQIDLWAEANRAKMSELAVRALALLGTETALTVVNSMPVRFRTKYKNIAETAKEAFEEAAEARGVTVSELGNSIVPKLGFELGKPKLLKFGNQELELSIGPDFKLRLFDHAKKKKIASLPKFAPPEIQAEFKELRDSLKEVLKAEIPRMENLLVQEHRWPIDRFLEFYMKHPLLRPFTFRLIWGMYDNEGKFQKTFRALEDGTLSDHEDNRLEIPDSGTVGIVHPLELDESLKIAWLSHLADYDIFAPFPQLERKVFRPEEKDLDRTYLANWQGTEIIGTKFNSRALRRSWRRGSVQDAGSVPAYFKSFSESGVDVFLFIEGMHVTWMHDYIRLLDLCFVRSGTVKIGSYVYDEPDSRSGKDERIIPIKDVPPIVYSETIADMQAITEN